MWTSLGAGFAHSMALGGLRATFFWGAAFSVILGSCRQSEEGEGSGAVAAGAWPADVRPNMASLANESLIRVGNLQANQLVLTIDESPFYSWTDKLAENLKSGPISENGQKPISAVFFVVANKVMDDVRGVAEGTADEKTRAFSLPKSGSRLINIHAANSSFAAGRLNAIVANGHFVANHSFSHPIAGAASPFDKRMRGFDGLFRSGEEAEKNHTVDEVVWTHQVIAQALKNSNPTGNQYLRWFRPPGGAWAGKSQGAAIEGFISKNEAVSKSAANYVGPVGWTVPESGKRADWQCFGQLAEGSRLADAKAHASACVSQNYIASLKGAGFRGLVLFHGNLVKKVRMPARSGQSELLEDFSYSEEVVSEFVRQARALPQGVQFVSPKCFVKC
ncbi:MAG: polysaccharide deacetylase family protein [Silvanigrellales bacterium]|nr:polysaccharide deacetylase family protein [Silvanigrellales bacterium]